MHAKQSLLIERSFLTVGSIAFIALATICAAAIHAHILGVSADNIVKALVAGELNHVFFPTAMLCVGSFWVVLYMRLGR